MRLSDAGIRRTLRRGSGVCPPSGSRDWCTGSRALLAGNHADVALVEPLLEVGEEERRDFLRRHGGGMQKAK